MSAPEEPGPAPVPPDEPARLRALRSYRILDTPPEADFDDVAFLAARVCETPIALMSLVDGERQWFKARVGLGVRETPRDVAFCAHALAGGGLMEVRDALRDPRFAGNPLVTGDPKIRFYAGAPLVTSEGHALGTLCVIDRVPRGLSEEQRTALRILSRHIVICLELRRQTLRLQEALERLGVTEAALRDKEAFAQATVDALSSHIAIVDAQGVVLAANRSWRDFARANGADPQAVSQGASYLGVCEASALGGCAGAAAFGEGMRAVMSGRLDSFSLEYDCHSPDEERWFVGRVTPFAGATRGVAVAHEDVTARRQAEEEVRTFSERLERRVAERTAELGHREAYQRTILDNSFDGIAILDLEGEIRYASPAVRGILGYGSGETPGPDGFAHVHSEDVARVRQGLARLASGGLETWEDELRLRHQTGSYRLVEARGIDLTRNPVVQGILVSFRDITARRRAEAALHDLSRRALSDQEEERRRISRELHDEIGQLLTAVKIGLQTVERRAQEPLAERVRDSIGSIDQAIEDVRRLALDLRPSLLDDLGLAAALRWYVDRQARTASLQVSLAADLGGRFPPDVETACFRIVQEALTNVLRHAGARHVWVEARREGDAIDLSVRDDGQGFDPDLHGTGLGLAGMRERVSLLRGVLDVRSAPGQGTAVRARIPLPHAPRPEAP